MVQSTQKQNQLKTLNLSASSKLALRKSSKKIIKKDKTVAVQCSKTQIKKQTENKMSPIIKQSHVLNCNNKNDQNQNQN
jgi:ribosome biogenesis protein Tsr3